MSTLQQRRDRLKALEKHREDQRQRLDGLLKKKDDILKEIKELEVVLEELDGNIDSLEEQVYIDEEEAGGADKQVASVQEPSQVQEFDPSQTQANECLTDPTSQTQALALPQPKRTAASRVSLESTQLTEPPSQTQIVDEQEDDYSRNVPVAALSRPRSAGSSVGQLEFTTITNKKKKAPKPKSTAETGATTTIDCFFKPTTPAPAPAASTIQPPTSHATAAPSSHSHASSNQFSHSNFPWSAQVQDLLQNTFQIQQFREHQKEVINATLDGRDVFVLMRTGGGKSLTYQIPALLEGRLSGRGGKVTFVISPLLSLIKDQEDQMNQFAPGSAISFTSNITGGQSEHARRWNLVRDPDQGVCLVFVTPEKVHKSNKLKSEMQKLHQQNRLGRFVIDEAHCSSNWGHDYRPDYSKLGILREVFPDIPILAVTATASERVRHDVCDILRISRNCFFFRSTANRPNLTYEVRPKKSNGDSVLDDMAAFIKEKYPSGAGIIYTMSRKDADTVADKLGDRGIIAQSYHSDVSPTKKDQIHRSWMRNGTQVVVATIAFGLGINKPDVRFVLHHTISKTLEAYYQESGRAGRDGKPAHCILYYSPKDVPRLLKMVHGEHRGAQQAFWQMCRYAQKGGDDEVCRSILLTALGEPDMNLEAEQQRQEKVGEHFETRDVTEHAKTVVQLLEAKQNNGENVTLNMLVKEWRTKDNVHQCVKKNPPGTDLNVDECERLIIALLIGNLLVTHFSYNAYDTVVHLKLNGSKGHQFLASPNPSVVVRFPKRGNAAGSSTGKKKKARQAVPDEDGWISTKPAAKKARRSSTSSTGSKKSSTTRGAKSKQSGTAKGKATATATRKTQKSSTTSKKKAPTAAGEVIELCSSDEDEKPVEKKNTSRPSRACALRAAVSLQNTEEDALWDDDSEENEFTG